MIGNCVAKPGRAQRVSKRGENRRGFIASHPPDTPERVSKRRENLPRLVLLVVALVFLEHLERRDRRPVIGLCPFELDAIADLRGSHRLEDAFDRGHCFRVPVHEVGPRLLFARRQHVYDRVLAVLGVLLRLDLADDLPRRGLGVLGDGGQRAQEYSGHRHADKSEKHGLPLS